MSPKRCATSRDSRVDGGAVGDVEPHARAAALRFVQIAAESIAAPFIGRRGADHGRAGVRERERDRLADAARRAGDERHLVRRACYEPSRVAADADGDRFGIVAAAAPRRRARCAWRGRRAPCPARTRRCASRPAPRTPGSSRSSAPGLAACCASAARIASGDRRRRDVDIVDHRDRRARRREPRRGARAVAPPRASSARCETARYTGNSTARLAPFVPWQRRSRARPPRDARRSRSGPGALKLTGSTTSPCAASRHAARDAGVVERP